MPVIAAGAPVKSINNEETTLKTFWQDCAPDETIPQSLDEAPVSSRVLYFKRREAEKDAFTPFLAIEVDNYDIEEAKKILPSAVSFETTTHNQHTTLFVTSGTQNINNLIDTFKARALGVETRRVLSTAMVENIHGHLAQDICFNKS